MSQQSPLRRELKAVHPLWRWGTLLGIGLILLLLLLFGAFGGYHTAKIWRAHGLARAAMKTLDQHSTTEAESELMAAYHLAPHDAEVLRACARCELAMMNPQALGFYQELLKSSQATRADQRAALRACLVFGNLNIADELAASLMAKEPEADDYVCVAQVRWQQNASTMAVALMRQALTLAPENRSYQLLLAQMLASSSEGDNQEEAMTLFRKLAAGQDQESLDALVAISRSNGLDKDTLRAVLDQIRRHPLLDDTGRFAGWELEARLADRDPKQVLQEVVDFYKSVDLAHKSTAARWLYGHDQPELALELASPPDTVASKELFLVRLDALGYLKNWSEVEKELADLNIPLSQTLIFLYRARAEQELGDLAVSRADWDRARAAAATESGMLAYLGAYAVKMHLYDEAKKTFSQMAQSPGQTEAGYLSLLELEAQHGSTSELLATLEQMTVDLPQKSEPKNDWAYLSLLLNLNGEKAWATAQALVTAHPEILAYRSTLALAYLRRHDFSGAAKVYQGLQIDWRQAPASWKMVYALVLAANGDNSQAETLARSINRSQLRQEELTLLDANLPEPSRDFNEKNNN